MEAAATLVSLPLGLDLNASDEDDPLASIGFQESIWRVQVVILFLLFLLGLLANMSVLWMLLKDKVAVNRTIRLLIIHLIIADLFVVIFCILTLAIWHYTVQWLAGDFLCRFSKYMQMFSLYASTFMITIISIDRCLVIAAPMSRLDNTRCTRLMIGVAWTLAAIFSIPQAFIFKVEQAPPSVTPVEFYQCVTFGSYTAAWQEQLYASFTLLVNFIVPLNTMIVCYAVILHKLFMHQSKFKRHPSGSGSHANCTITGLYRPGAAGSFFADMTSLNRRTARMKKATTTSLWISILIVLAFIICWAPYYARMLGAFIWEDAGANEPSNVDNFIFFFGMTNSVLNPAIYGAFHIMKRTKRTTSCRRQPSLYRTDFTPSGREDLVS